MYPEALPLPQSWDQPQAPPAPPASLSEVPRPWWEVKLPLMHATNAGVQSCRGNLGSELQVACMTACTAYSRTLGPSCAQMLQPGNNGISAVVPGSRCLHLARY